MSGKIKTKSLLKYGGLYQTRISILALLFALIMSGILILISGYNPLDIYMRVFTLTFSSTRNVSSAFAQAIPLMFSGLGFAIAMKANVINLGLEGQMLMGAMASAIVGANFGPLPPFLHITLAMLLAALAGGLTALIPGVLKIKFGAIELITTVMVNEIVDLFTSFLCNGPLKAKSAIFGMTEKIYDSAIIPKVVEKSQLTYAIFIAIVLAVFLYIFLNKTVVGYNLRVVGLNMNAAKTAGIKVGRIYLLAFFLSGALAGLCGGAMILGVNLRFIQDFSDGYGWSGIAVAALASYNPISVPLSALLFGVLKAGAMILNRTSTIPIEFVSTIQAFVIVFVAAPRMIESFIAFGKSALTSILGLSRKKSNIPEALDHE